MKRIALLLGALGLAGCAGIPNSGPVVQGARVDVTRNDGYVRVIARAPARGIKPDALVRGFLNACASVADGDNTALKYLTESAAEAWNPDAKTEVYDAGSLTLSLERNDRVRITAPLLGTIDARHRYSVAEPGAILSEDLQLKQINGEWRIDAAPAALYLGQGDVARGFRAHPVYFLNASRTRLVPEYVMLPLGTGNVVSALTRAVLSGPVSAGLATAARPGTQVQYGNTAGYFGAATVGLDKRVLALPGPDREALIAQLTWTLTALSTISSVNVQVDGAALETANGYADHTRLDLRRWDPTRESGAHTLLYIRDGQLWSSVAGVARRVGTADADAAAEASLSADGRTVVAVSASRKLLSVSVSGGRPRYIAAGSDLAAPAVLSNGEAWFVDREAKGQMLTWDVSRGVRPIDTGLPPRARILDFAIAPDEVRIALIVNNGATTTVRVGTIVRSASGIRLAGLARVEQTLSTALAIAWTGESELGVIGAVGAVAVQPVSVSLPLGSVALIGGPANALTLAAVPGAATVVGDQAGQLWEYRGGRWDASEFGSAPAYAR